MSTTCTEPAVKAGDDEDRTHPTADILNSISSLNSNPVTTESQERPQSLQPQAPSEYDVLNKQIADNPHDHAAWRRLIDVAEATGDIDTISATYEAHLKQFPNTVCLPPLTFDMSESFFLSQRVRRPKLKSTTSVILRLISLCLRPYSTSSSRAHHASNFGVSTCHLCGTASHYFEFPALIGSISQTVEFGPISARDCKKVL